MKIIGIHDLNCIIQKHGMSAFFEDLLSYLREDFTRWEDFDKSARYASYTPDGVLELMPISDPTYFTYKYVNGHPKNPEIGKQTVVAVGQLTCSKTGYPLMISEMTLLTAIRTAATAALATDLLSRKESSVLCIIGTGSQSEFQVLAQNSVRKLNEVRYTDRDHQAMAKFAHNLKEYAFTLTPCVTVEEALKGADIIITCTANKGHMPILNDSMIREGVHLNALGGDSPGKTELDLDLIKKSRITVEYLPQTRIEGEIQRLSKDEVDSYVCAELWELVIGKKIGRTCKDDVTLFDSVGFALEDYSALRLVFDLSTKYGIGQDADLIPYLQNPKDLFSALTPKTSQLVLKRDKK